MTAGPGAARAGRREWIALGVLALPCLLYAMDLTVLNLAVPAISKSLRPSGVELLWIVDIYGFVLAGSLITMGALGDRIGRRLLLAGFPPRKRSRNGTCARPVSWAPGSGRRPPLQWPTCRVSRHQGSWRPCSAPICSAATTRDGHGSGTA